MKKKFDIQKSIIYIAFIALFVIFSITLRNVGAGFASISNIMNILRQTCLVAIMAVGMTFVLGAALIDLSYRTIGSMYIFGMWFISSAIWIDCWCYSRIAIWCVSRCIKWIFNCIS